MTTDRRTLLKCGLASVAALQASGTGRKALAAPADEPIRIDPNPGYHRIACEEAWTTKEVVEAQVRRAESSWAQTQPYVASMARGFANNARFQEPLQDIGAGRIAAMDRLGIQKAPTMFGAGSRARWRASRTKFGCTRWALSPPVRWTNFRI
jgi:hypothetical protein